MKVKLSEIIDAIEMTDQDLRKICKYQLKKNRGHDRIEKIWAKIN